MVIKNETPAKRALLSYIENHDTSYRERLNTIICQANEAKANYKKLGYVDTDLCIEYWVWISHNYGRFFSVQIVFEIKNEHTVKNGDADFSCGYVDASYTKKRNQLGAALESEIRI